MAEIAILASGNGTNAENIIRYFQAHPSEGHVSILLSNNINAKALARADSLGVRTATFTASDLKERTETVVAMLKDIDFIILAGFMMLIPDMMVSRFRNRILNIHPALLPKFGGKGMYGIHVHKAVIDSGEKTSGITIHKVNERYDSGDIIFQSRTEVLANDTPESLAERIHGLEYRFYPSVISSYIAGFRD